MTDQPVIDLQRLFVVAAGFAVPAPVDHISPLGSGLINDTFLVGSSALPARQQYVLQRINKRVFPSPLAVMENIQLVLTHLHAELEKTGLQNEIVFPSLICALDGKPYYLDDENEVWRLISYIGPSRTIEKVTAKQQVIEIGSALAKFHLLTRTLDPRRLQDTLPGFHISSRYLAAYDQMPPQRESGATEKLQYCRQAIESGRSRVNCLEQARARGELPVAVMHGDPKINNFLFHEDSDRVLSLIDLDTVKPGLILYDLADCVRSCCNPAGENEDGAGEYFEFDYFLSLLQAYFASSGSLMAVSERKYIYDAVRLMPYELGLRFYTDHLAGNCYFKVEYDGHNLDRALRQFRMLAAIEARQSEIDDFVAELSGNRF